MAAVLNLRSLLRALLLTECRSRTGGVADLRLCLNEGHMHPQGRSPRLHSGTNFELLGEPQVSVRQIQRVVVTTLTKRMA